jgi:hypothetical protein
VLAQQSSEQPPIVSRVLGAVHLFFLEVLKPAAILERARRVEDVVLVAILAKHSKGRKGQATMAEEESIMPGTRIEMPAPLLLGVESPSALAKPRTGSHRWTVLA